MTRSVGVNYVVEPSSSDGYSVCLVQGGVSLVYAYIEKLKWIQPDGIEPGGHKAVGYPRIQMADSDYELIQSALVTMRIPTMSALGKKTRDGVGFTLKLGTGGYGIEIQWHNSLPDELKELLPVIEVLDRYATLSLRS